MEVTLTFQGNTRHMEVTSAFQCKVRSEEVTLPWQGVLQGEMWSTHCRQRYSEKQNTKWWCTSSSIVTGYTMELAVQHNLHPCYTPCNIDACVCLIVADSVWTMRKIYLMISTIWHEANTIRISVDSVSSSVSHMSVLPVLTECLSCMWHSSREVI